MASRKAFGSSHFASYIILASTVTHLFQRWQGGFVCSPQLAYTWEDALPLWFSVHSSQPAAPIASLPALLHSEAAVADTKHPQAQLQKHTGARASRMFLV